MTDNDIALAIARELRDRGTKPNVTVDDAIAAAAPERASRVALLAELEDLRLLAAEVRQEYASPERKAARITTMWTALDVIAHLASWAAETRREAASLLAGRTLGYAVHFEKNGGPREWNQREVDARATFGLTELIAELTDETVRLAEIVRDAPQASLDAVVELPRTAGDPPQRWRMPLGAMIAGSCWHARLHLRRLLPERYV